MTEKSGGSYARRSQKYQDNSHFGGYESDAVAQQDTETQAYDEASPSHTAEVPEIYAPDASSKEREPLRRRSSEKRSNTATRADGHRKKREAVGWILSICLAVAAALLIRAFVFEIILVDGISMYPTLETDERVAVEKVTRYGGLPNRGDIIIVKYPNLTGTYVKRTIGLPGETVEVVNSTVYIDGVPLEEDYVNPEPYSDMAPQLVPEDHVFVMGDNRAHSLDSRTEKIGPIAHSEIIGHGVFVIWPLNNIHGIS